jgi:outer membrane receptor protein involved in Fe transport
MATRKCFSQRPTSFGLEPKSLRLHRSIPEHLKALALACALAASALPSRSAGLTVRVLININGLRVNDPVYDGGPIENVFPLDMDLIERIEFIAGPGGAVYGQNAMFGVVNIITRTGAQVNGGELGFSYQGPQASRTAQATWGKHLDNGVDVLVSVSGMRSEGQDHFFSFGSTGVSGVASGMDRERGQRLYARAARGTWGFELVHSDRTKDDPTALPGQLCG